MHTSSSVSAWFSWNPGTSLFTIENSFNVAEFERTDVGVYDISFTLPLADLPVVQLTPETLAGEGVKMIVASYEDFSASGLRVRLVEMLDGVPTPVDWSFSLLIP